MRGQRERGQDAEAAVGEGRERGRWGGLTWRGWEGPRGRGGGWGWDCGASSEGEAGRGGRPRSGRAGGQRSAPLSRLSLPPECPRPGPEAAPGHYGEFGPSPLPPRRGGGRGRGNHQLGEGGGRRRELMAPTRHPETGPAAASPHAALSHSSGCDRDGGSRERGRGRPLKRQPLRQALGAAEDKGQGRDRSPLGLLVQLGGGPCPPDGPEPVSHQQFANACHLLLRQGLSILIPQPPWGPSLGAPIPTESKRIPWDGSRS